MVCPRERIKLNVPGSGIDALPLTDDDQDRPASRSTREGPTLTVEQWAEADDADVDARPVTVLTTISATSRESA